MAQTEEERRICRRETTRKYRETHQDEIKKYNHDYGVVNRGKITERTRKWRVNNSGRANELQRKWYSANREKAKERTEEYRKEHPDRAKRYRDEHRKERNAYNKKWRESNPDKAKQHKIRYRMKYPDKDKEYARWYREAYPKSKEDKKYESIKYLYGLSKKEYDLLYISQSGKCLICGISESESYKPLGIDHNHRTGKIRGLLCNRCNTVLGMVDDNIDILVKSIEYLRREA